MDNPTEGFIEISQRCDPFFKEALTGAIKKYGVNISENASFYVLSILVKAMKLTDDERVSAREIFAIRYKNALERTITRGNAATEFRSIGDSSLMISGVWWPSLLNKNVGVDYYIEIGRRAYQRAGKNCDKKISEILFELSGNFTNFVKILTSATLCIYLSRHPSDSAILKMYQIYLKTEDSFIAKIIAENLRVLGINVSSGNFTKQ